jgi:hypothetical protein
MKKSWCMECKRFGCKSAMTLKTGWTFVDNKHVNVAIHRTAVESSAVDLGEKEAAMQA